jgi:hypothetical protein
MSTMPALMIARPVSDGRTRPDPSFNPETHAAACFEAIRNSMRDPPREGHELSEQEALARLSTLRPLASLL